MQGHVKCCRVLLDSGYNVNYGGRKKIDVSIDTLAYSVMLWLTHSLTHSLTLQTPIHKAAGNGFVEVLELLVERKADVNSLTRGACQTPLMRASAAGKIEAAEWLLHNQADPNLLDVQKKSALMIAKEAAGAREQIIELLSPITTVEGAEGTEDESNEELEDSSEE